MPTMADIFSRIIRVIENCCVSNSTLGCEHSTVFANCYHAQEAECRKSRILREGRLHMVNAQYPSSLDILKEQVLV